MQTNELLPSVCQFISEIEKKSSVFQCSFYQNFNFTAVKISFLKQFRELTNDTMMWDNINWQCRWNQTCEEAIWCMETIPVIRRLQPRKFHESHLQSILPAEAPTSSTTAAVAPTSCTTAAVAPTSCTTPAVAPTSSTTLNVTFGRADLQLEPDLEMDTLFAHNMKTKIKAQLHRELYRQFWYIRDRDGLEQLE